ncbi:hypothetical protein [Tenacibaculum sp. 190130A14a]|uniref:hypothetical protein n=1 Tax=Tenacibaculum polynesiense TaxID=3137857 RepID=UPI0032B3050D
MTKTIEYQGKYRLTLTDVLNKFVTENPKNKLNIIPDNFIIKRKSWIRLTISGNETEIDHLIHSIDQSL